MSSRVHGGVVGLWIFRYALMPVMNSSMSESTSRPSGPAFSSTWVWRSTTCLVWALGWKF